MLNRKRIQRVTAAVFGIGLSVALSTTAKAAQVPLDPNGFTSLGSLSGATNYVVNTGDGTSIPTLTEDGSTVLNGQISNGVAVFDFSSINLSSASTLTATGSLPLALLSRDGVSLAGLINLSANGSTAGAGGGNGGTSSAPAGGPGAGALAAGGGFGGKGGNSAVNMGGSAYGDSTHAFFGGSGGGGAALAGTGGGAGGGLEISALQDITLTGSNGIKSNGAIGGDSGAYPGGGGSGGGIFLATPGQITSDAPLQAFGGGGGNTINGAEGGGGGGGRILLETANFVTNDPSLVNVSGGAHGQGTVEGFDGEDGTFDVTGYVPTPEPGSLSLVCVGAAVMTWRSRRRLGANQHQPALTPAE